MLTVGLLTVAEVLTLTATHGLSARIVTAAIKAILHVFRNIISSESWILLV
jgi:hypothetical protein